MAPWRPALPDFSFFLDNPELVARSAPGQLGPGCVLVDRWQGGGRPPSSRLLHQLERSTAAACSVCDPGGRQPFARRAQLEAHLREAHGRHACGMCLAEARTFPLEQPLYASPAALRAHAAAAHPRCAFCRNRAFFDSDALWAHMGDAHFRCQLCDPGGGGGNAYFADAGALRQHLAADHHACDDPDCVACLVAFATADELRRHLLRTHSARMPRWDPRTARPLELDVRFTRRAGDAGGGGPGPGAGGDGGRGGRGRGLRAQDVRLRDDAPRDAPPAGRRGGEYASDFDGGHAFYDDDLGMLGDHEPIRRGGGGGHPAPLVGAAWAGRQPPRRGGGQGDRPEEFPSLAAAAAAAVPDTQQQGAGGAEPGGGGGGGERRRAARPLVKHTLKCPCGRRVSHVVVEEGEAPPALACDGVCQLEGRRARLADAFGVADPARHAGAFQPRRNAVWSGALLAAARRQPAWVAGLEAELADFLGDAGAKR